ncbi:hypothetical protein AK830_g9405 [Neonectria ditissima]|uniref:Bromo domain-containing protein n=1 Tax=Neonectria ditissima TaxID=78410 RepID=A0A0P7B5S4_9HYPO|nr:hypothetical protein AK830_g9405 [Neonectria ditissima]
METKRKANGAAPVETPDRSAKRRKLAEFDLSKGETPESTTVYGLSFLEQIRRTADKSGRLVATYFERLPPRQSNAEYYKRTRLPISLETAENKLNKGEFETLAELESYFKRMIANAKEFYPRSSSTFDDAERIRKALSNYMTKTNPAYHNRGYQAVPTPLPPDSEDAEDEDAEGEENDDGEGEDEEDNEGADNEDEDADADEDEKEEEPEEEEEEEEEEPSSRKRSIILKRRGSGRPTRAAASKLQESPQPSTPSNLPDHQFENVPYKGLSFQQAQEKIVEELLRHQEPEYEDAYFEPFINLPPRALKDYYKVISDPLSIKKLQKMVKGVHGRGETTGASDFKTWGAFAEKSKLLWKNAYFYNEEGSEIYTLAQELAKFFSKELKKAQAVVPEPTQAKIRLKVGQGAESTPSTKKITIHVGGRGDSADSPAPQTIQSSDGSTNGQPVNGIHSAISVQPSLPQLDKARSVSASVPSPSPSTIVTLKAEDGSAVSPVVVPRSASAVSAQATPTIGAPIPAVQSQPVQQNPLVNGYMEQKRFRGPGKGVDDALISRVKVQLHPAVQAQSSTVATVMPHPTEMVQSATVNLPAHLGRVLVIPLLPDLLRTRQYSLWTVVNKQPLKPSHQQALGQQPQERAFEAILHPGVNVVETHLIAAIPRSERVPGGPEVELEVFTIFINVLRT